MTGSVPSAASPCRTWRGSTHPGSTVHVDGRCNHREFCFTTPDDFWMLLAPLGEIARTYEVSLYAYALLANHVHLLLQAPLTDPLARPLRRLLRRSKIAG